MSSGWKPARKPAGGFPGQNLETRRPVSRSKAGNPPLVRFQKAGNPPAGFQVKKLETRHLGLPMMTQWAKVTKMFQNTKILTEY